MSTRITLPELRAGCPDVDERVLVGHLERLDAEYFDAFDRAAVVGHAGAVATLSPEHPVRLLVAGRADGRIDCTIVAFDYPSEFSLIAGILAGTGFSILSGEVFTYKPAPELASRELRRSLKSEDEYRAALQRRRRCIIDHFEGRVDPALSREEWKVRVEVQLVEVMRLLESGSDADHTQARRTVNEFVAARLRELKTDDSPILYPVTIDMPETQSAYRTLGVTSQDTPAFLYALSNALSLQGVSIEGVRIKTVDGKVYDEIDILDTQGERISDPGRVDQIKLSVLLTKQFTYFLTRTPDAFAALSRFEQLTHLVVDQPDHGQWLDLFGDPTALKGLARILGTSDFIWEDFVRAQYEALLPLLDPQAGERLSFSESDLEDRLRAALGGGGGSPTDDTEVVPPEPGTGGHPPSLEGRAPSRPCLRGSRERSSAEVRDPGDARRILNEWKDREIFLIDLDHILHSGADVRALAEPLTRLAGIVVRQAVKMVYAGLTERHGAPRTVAGLDARFAWFGLGKFGGEALGYASDIELLFVYSDNGRTDGREPLSNAEFFDQLVLGTSGMISAKREGIFQVDLRLRPHGNAGPKACSLESFCRYYGRSGAAHSYELLALTRLRWVGGDLELGRQVERLRDEFVYVGPSIEPEALMRLREVQFGEKIKGERTNAKFSQGALVDLEYFVQILQVMHGGAHPELRSPRLHEAVSALSAVGVLSAEERVRLTDAYFFLRRLINGLRMLRGSAKDLFLPSVVSDEFGHLARRMGYEGDEDLDPTRKLFLDFELHTAAVRTFVEQHFGRESLPGPATGNAADLVLSDAVPEALRDRILRDAGFRNTDRAYRNLQCLTGGGSRRDLFAPLAVLAFDRLRLEPDPDMALNNWERYLEAIGDPELHFQTLLSQPRRLEILLGIFSRSQFLSDTVIRDPEFLDWVTAPENLHKRLTREGLESELRGLSAAASDATAWRRELRRFRRREMLRIGTRDMCLRAPIREIVSDLSMLAEAVIQCTLERVWASVGRAELDLGDFCVLAFGKLGGAELNYSSDVDLLGVYRARPGQSADAGEAFGRLLGRVRDELSRHTAEGYVYRVDLRLRPYGRAGEMVQSTDGVVAYYESVAAPWEIQALLKLRPVAGGLATGRELLERLRRVFLVRRSAPAVRASIQRMRAESVRLQASGACDRVDVKSGEGGLRDIEFLVQGLQLIHAPDHPDVVSGNTLDGLDRLRRLGLLPDAAAEQLSGDYEFLRRVEHFLQILEDRQTHAIPSDPNEMESLAKRVMGTDARVSDFAEHLQTRLMRVRRAYTEWLRDGGPAAPSPAGSESGSTGPGRVVGESVA